MGFSAWGLGFRVYRVQGLRWLLVDGRSADFVSGMFGVRFRGWSSVVQVLDVCVCVFSVYMASQH